MDLMDIAVIELREYAVEDNKYGSQKDGREQYQKGNCKGYMINENLAAMNHRQYWRHIALLSSIRQSQRTINLVKTSGATVSMLYSMIVQTASYRVKIAVELKRHNTKQHEIGREGNGSFISTSQVYV